MGDSTLRRRKAPRPSTNHEQLHQCRSTRSIRRLQFRAQVIRLQRASLPRSHRSARLLAEVADGLTRRPLRPPRGLRLRPHKTTQAVTEAGSRSDVRLASKQLMKKKRLLFLAALLVCSVSIRFTDGAVIYQTSFEKSEGYDLTLNLVGQRGWVGDGTGGNGLVESIPDMGQQAYIGFFPPTDTKQTTTVYSPLNFTPATSAKIV